MRGGQQPGAAQVGRGLTCVLPQVQWVSAAVLRQVPPAAHDYANVLEPAAWAWGAGSRGLAPPRPVPESR